LFATDLQGNWGDYQRLKEIYAQEEALGSQPILLLCGDLVHGPGGDIALRENWPDYLGTFYEDRSCELLLDFERWSSEARVASLIGNHEHAHVGGPVVSKFFEDEAGHLDELLGAHKERLHAFLSTFPLLAVAPCGAAFTHGAPRATEATLDSFENLSYPGYEHFPLFDMYEVDTLGALLWARGASAERTKAFLEVVTLRDRPSAFCAYGHDVVRQGYEKEGEGQICVSTSYGLDDENKVYLRLDLAANYSSVHDLREGHEILKLHPEAAGG
jgi:hypothetical protein